MPVRAVSIRLRRMLSRHWASVNPATPLFLHLLFEHRQVGGGFIECFLQRGESLLVLPKTSCDADVDFGTRVVFATGQQFWPGFIDALLGEASPRLLKHPPTLETSACHFEVIARIVRAAVDQRGLQRSDRFFNLPLASTNGGDFFHPLRIFVGQLIDVFVVGGSFLEAHQALFEARHAV